MLPGIPNVSPLGRAAADKGPAKPPMLSSVRLHRLNAEKIFLFRRFLREDPGATYDLHKAFNVDPERDDEKSIKRGFVQPEAFVKRTRIEINKIRKLKHRKYNEGGELVGVRVTNEEVPRRVRERLILSAMREDAQFQIDRFGLSDSIINGIRHAFCRKEVVRLSVQPPWKDNMKEMAKRIEERTGGVIVDRAGGRVLLYRGFTDADLARKGLLSPLAFNDVEVRHPAQRPATVPHYTPTTSSENDTVDKASDDHSGSTPQGIPVRHNAPQDEVTTNLVRGKNTKASEDQDDTNGAESRQEDGSDVPESDIDTILNEGSGAQEGDELIATGDVDLAAVRNFGPNGEEEEEEKEETWRAIAKREFDPMEDTFAMNLEVDKGADDTKDRDADHHDKIMDLFGVVETGNRGKRKSRKKPRYRRKP
ncbi:hypothetical protein BSKO_01871 [Bryopsis sp. KO-2023]|nr:hypothetical protein BSKO_01871 [Bryopsis sp. KO-2023]